MISLFENNKESKEITIYLIGDGISDENKRLLEQIALQYNRICIVIDLPVLNIPQSLYSQRWPKSAFTRLYSGKILPEFVEKVIYLDCDTVVRGSLQKLWSYNTKDFYVWGVKDCISRFYRKNIGLNNDDIYINAGVLVMNIKKMREENISFLIDEFLRKYSKTMHYADQDVLNGIFAGKMGVLPPKYNIMSINCVYNYKQILRMRRPHNYYSEDMFNEQFSDMKIIHYTTCMTMVRPWIKNTDHPYSDVFNHYKRISPWRERELNDVPKMKIKDYFMIIFFKFPSVIRNEMIGLVHAYFYPLWISFRKK